MAKQKKKMCLMMVKKQESGTHLQFAAESELYFRIEVNRAAIIIIYVSF